MPLEKRSPVHRHGAVHANFNLDHEGPYLPEILLPWDGISGAMVLEQTWWTDWLLLRPFPSSDQIAWMRKGVSSGFGIGQIYADYTLILQQTLPGRILQPGDLGFPGLERIISLEYRPAIILPAQDVFEETFASLRSRIQAHRFKHVLSPLAMKSLRKGRGQWVTERSCFHCYPPRASLARSCSLSDASSDVAATRNW